MMFPVPDSSIHLSDTVGNNEKWLVFYGNAAVLATVLRYVFYHRTKGVGKVAKDRYCSPTVVIDVFFSLFIWPSSWNNFLSFSAHSSLIITVVIDLSIRAGAAIMTIPLITNH